MAVEKLEIVEKGSMRELSEFVAHFISLDHEEASARLPGAYGCRLSDGALFAQSSTTLLSKYRLAQIGTCVTVYAQEQMTVFCVSVRALSAKGRTVVCADRSLLCFVSCYLLQELTQHLRFISSHAVYLDERSKLHSL